MFASSTEARICGSYGAGGRDTTSSGVFASSMEARICGAVVDRSTDELLVVFASSTEARICGNLTRVEG